MQDTIPRTDMSGYKSASGAAKALAKHLEELEEALGGNANLEVTLYRPEENPHSNAWGVTYSAGPWGWAINPEQEIPGLKGIHDMDGVLAEPYNGSFLCFYKH